jgi:phosphoribosylformylglycinamidine cyclo-ligase
MKKRKRVTHKDLYKRLGVDSGKGSVRKAFKGVLQNEFPGAFVNIVADPMVPGWVMTQHVDGDGSKIVARLIRYLESGISAILKGVVDDGMTMNYADVAAAGFVYGYSVITDSLNVGVPENIKKPLMVSVSARITELIKLYKQHGIDLIYFLGGETADLPNQVCSAVFDITVNAHMPRGKVIAGNVRPGDIIYGLSSGGKALWEEIINSGLMSNGLTLGSSCLLHESYNGKYRDILRNEKWFQGRFRIGDVPDGLGMEVSEALLSPTRQWAIFIRKFMDHLGEQGIRHMLKGISVNTGGGGTKICHVGTGGIRYVKKMPEPGPIFQLIHEESGQDWEHMFKTFNCSVGLDIVGNDDPQFNAAIRKVAGDCHIGLHRLGTCEFCRGKNNVVLETPYGIFDKY